MVGSVHVLIVSLLATVVAQANMGAWGLLGAVSPEQTMEVWTGLHDNKNTQIRTHELMARHIKLKYKLPGHKV